MRKKLAITSSLEELASQLHELDLDQPWPDGADGPRGRTSWYNSGGPPGRLAQGPVRLRGRQRRRGAGRLRRLSAYGGGGRGRTSRPYPVASRPVRYRPPPPSQPVTSGPAWRSSGAAAAEFITLKTTLPAR
ncbi:hypothetical protein SCALM49S_03738 [Streptomyces californicus]